MPHVEYEHPLRQICEAWISKINKANKVKHDKFGQFANEGEKFYDGAHNFMWDEEYSRGKGGFIGKGADDSAIPCFQMTVNRIFEAVALFGPALVHKNPDIQVEAVKYPEIPPEALGIVQEDEVGLSQYQNQVQQDQMEYSNRVAHAAIKESVLNWVQIEGAKKQEARRAVTDAIVAGAGYLWTEIKTHPTYGVSYPKSGYISWRDITKDPDACYREDIQWIARRIVKPVNLVEEEFGLPAKTLKRFGSQSYESQSTQKGKEEGPANRKGDSFDLLEYWEVYSKNGFGHKLNGEKIENTFSDKLSPLLDRLGKYTRIVVAKDVPFPLNLPSDKLPTMDFDDMFTRCQWPVPFYEDHTNGGGWPFVEFGFYEKSKDIWPISLVKPCVGELRFINWAMSFMADKVSASSQTILAIMASAAEDMQEQLQSQTGSYAIYKMEQKYGKSIKEVIQFLDAPDFSDNLWKVVSQVMENVDKRLGLTELLYGLTTRQMRSATEADVKDQNVSIRPDDMAEKVEDALSAVVVREAQAACWHLSGDDVHDVVGEMGSLVWDTQIRQRGFERVVRDFSYKIIAGSARKPNKQQKVKSLQELGQAILPTIQQYAAQGQVGPWNAYMTEIGRAMDVDIEGFMLQPPEPQEGPSPEEMKMEIEQAKLEMQQQKTESDIQRDQIKMAMEAKRDQAKMMMEGMAGQTKLELEQAGKELEMQGKQIDHTMTMIQKQDEHAMKILHGQQLHEQKLAQARSQKND